MPWIDFIITDKVAPENKLMAMRFVKLVLSGAASLRAAQEGSISFRYLLNQLSVAVL